MKRSQLISVGLLVVLAAAGALSNLLAQTPSVVDGSSQLNMSNAPETIDGSKHPELVPDLAAYRLWLIAVAADVQDHPEQTIKRRRALLKQAGVIQADDLANAMNIIVEFKGAYSDLLDSYNKNVTQESIPDLKPFLLQRDRLVQSTMTALGSMLSKNSFSLLQAHVRAEKSHMTVAKEVQ
jgi:hypothetical protein